MADVFISYKREERDIAEKLARARIDDLRGKKPFIILGTLSKKNAAGVAVADSIITIVLGLQQLFKPDQGTVPGTGTGEVAGDAPAFLHKLFPAGHQCRG